MTLRKSPPDLVALLFCVILRVLSVLVNFFHPSRRNNRVLWYLYLSGYGFFICWLFTTSMLWVGIGWRTTDHAALISVLFSKCHLHNAVFVFIHTGVNTQFQFSGRVEYIYTCHTRCNTQLGTIAKRTITEIFSTFVGWSRFVVVTVKIKTNASQYRKSTV